MARPTTKDELLKQANEQYEKLMSLIDGDIVFHTDIANSGKEAHWGRDKNLRDVLVHLYEWHQLLLVWVENNMNGNSTPFLPNPYTWKTYGDMNVKFWKKHQATPYEQAVDMLEQSHRNVIAMIENFSNEEMFEKKHFSWTGTNSIGAYCVSATLSHYDWAIKKIKTHNKLSK